METRVTDLCIKYRKSGGFGVYSVHRLCARVRDTKERIYQEDTLMDMYRVVYERDITRDILEKQYLGRRCVSAYVRYNLQLLYGIPRECVVNGEDPFMIFSRRYRVNGHTNRLYWKEKENEKDRFVLPAKSAAVENGEVTKSVLRRTKSSQNLV